MIIRDINYNFPANERYRTAESTSGSDYVPPEDTGDGTTDTGDTSDTSVSVSDGSYVPPQSVSDSSYVPPATTDDTDNTQDDPDTNVIIINNDTDGKTNVGTGKTNDFGGGGGYAGDEPRLTPDVKAPDLSKHKGYEFYGYYYTAEHLAGMVGGTLIGGAIGYKLGNVYIGVVTGFVLGFSAAVLLKKPEKS